ncbi:leucine-rich repeat-containing protein 47-like [Watersipora subatra]|uniref:leucine-rich repeat-containing protein 47-like n=1 Tax=Watersipora subatra TaxID=2589382 RepID=UPI00355C8D90
MWPEVQAAKKDKKKELLLDGAAISKRIEESGFDDSLFELVDVNLLRISQTSLQVLDPSISNLFEKLTSLMLHENQLTDLPESIGKLVHLKYLDVSRNKLTSVTPSVNNLAALLTLNLAQNDITTLPQMSGMVNLHDLFVTGNKLSCLPDDLCGLQHLATVQADHNQISSLPSDIGKMHMLKALHLAKNELTDLPPALVCLDKLRILDLRGNKFSDRRLLKLANVEQTQPKGVFKHLKPLYDKLSASGSKKSTPGGDSEDDELSEITESIRVLHCADDQASKVEVTITEEVAAVRPHIVCCIVRNIDLSRTATTYKQFIALQTRLHEGICEKRLQATIATHDLAQIRAPLKYDARNPSDTMVVPLGRQKAVTAADFMAKLKKEADDLRKAKKRNTTSGVSKYLDMLKGKTLYPFLLDRDDRVISFPPITNCESTKINAATRDVLVEVTSSKSLLICKQVAESLIKELLSLNIGSGLEGGAERTGNHLVVEQVRVVTSTAHLKTVYPSRIDLQDVPCHVQRD